MRDVRTTLLIVDDDAADRRAVERALRGSDLRCETVVAKDGLEALELLRGLANGQPIHRPVVILLDLKMPRMDGVEFLEELRRDPYLRDLVVFVLSTSGAPNDVRAAYDRQAAGYLQKSEVGVAPELLKDLLTSYLRAVHLPS